MKTFTTTRVTLSLLFIAILLLIMKCQEKRQCDPCPPERQFLTQEDRAKCRSLNDRAYRRELVIKFDQCKLDENIKDLDDVFGRLGKIIDPVDTCACDSTLILYRIKQGIDPEDALVETNQNIKPRGIGDAFFNFNLEVPKRLAQIGDSLKPYDLKQELVIAVIDGGINPALDPSINDFLWMNPDTSDPHATEHGYDFTEDFNSGGMIEHATLISKILSHNLNPKKLKLMDLRVFDDTGGGILFDALCAMQYAMDNGADIMNLSWGFYNQRFDPNFRKYIEKAKNKGIIIVASAGNDHINTDHCHHYPSGFDSYSFDVFADNVISVAYLDSGNVNLSPGSNYGYHSVSMAAPGTFRFMEGTSYAAPHITRLAAVVMSNRPDMNHRKIIACLKGQANQIPALAVNTQGKLTYSINYDCDPEKLRTDEDLYFSFPDNVK
jgi:subtilisin family serine protease